MFDFTGTAESNVLILALGTTVVYAVKGTGNSYHSKAQAIKRAQEILDSKKS